MFVCIIFDVTKKKRSNERSPFNAHVNFFGRVWIVNDDSILEAAGKWKKWKRWLKKGIDWLTDWLEKGLSGLYQGASLDKHSHTAEMRRWKQENYIKSVEGSMQMTLLVLDLSLCKSLPARSLNATSVELHRWASGLELNQATRRTGGRMEKVSPEIKMDGEESKREC